MVDSPEDNQIPAQAKKSRKKATWILSAGATVAVVALAAFVVPPMFAGDPVAVETTVAATSVPTPTAAKTYAPVTNFYKQLGPPAGSPLTPVAAQTVTVSADKVGTKLSLSQVGLSLEATDLADPLLSGDNESVVARLKGLGKPVLRFGGNAVDRRFFWTSTGEALPSSYVGTKPNPARVVGPDDFTRINGLLEKADAYISLSVNLGDYNPERAADLAKYGEQIFGKRLLAITIGNEPNGFAPNMVLAHALRPNGYTAADFGKEAKVYADAIYKVAPNVPISGPGTYAADWASAWVALDIKQPKILTFHNYPLTGCTTGLAADQPTMANLLAPEMHDRSIDYHKSFVAKGNAAKMPIWVDETGISACVGGNETTKTYASALWSTDYALGSAQVGVSQLDFHSSLITCKGGPPMSAVCFDGEYLKPTGVMQGRANYFGLSMVGAIGGGEFLKLNNDGGGLAHSYALQQSDGSTTVVLINQNNPETAAQTMVTLKLPNIPATATMTQMTGTSYGSEDSAAIDGQDAGPVSNDKQPAPMDFVPGKQSQTFPLTAGTVTLMNFKY
ncbi:hypothetical protein [Arthrobacter alpinus]|uniref:hypothetical protein n=1 Tax=Arthrobacter alpinus TaxID=656366 RepID=UPI0021BD614E|nr:hypothetical protein [Arthrobacter alpinus]